jgi:hypothetical protein
MYGKNWVRVHLKCNTTGAQKIRTMEALEFKRDRKKIEDDGYSVIQVAPVEIQRPVQ